jgi:hypothetical protein
MGEECVASRTRLREVARSNAAARSCRAVQGVTLRGLSWRATLCMSKPTETVFASKGRRCAAKTTGR